MAQLSNVEIFATGTWNGITFNSTDLDDIVQSFNELNLSGKLPVKLGHDAADTEPAQGWITALHKAGDKLLATIDQVPQNLVEEIRQGRWRHVSVELLKNVAKGDKKYPWVLDALAVLGAARPAVDVLQGLNQMVMRGWHVGARVSFNRKLGDSTNMSEVDLLKQQNALLTQSLITEKFNAAVLAQRITPAELNLFNKRFGNNATLADAESWIQTAQKPARRNDGQLATRQGTTDDLSVDMTPDKVIVKLTREKMEEHFKTWGEKLTFVQAQTMLFKSDDPTVKEKVRAYTKWSLRTPNEM